MINVTPIVLGNGSWVYGNPNPIFFGYQNDRWPNNNISPVEPVSIAPNVDGLLTFSAPLTVGLGLTVGNYIKLASTSYTGAYRVLSISGSSVTVNASGTLTEAGTAQYYFNNHSTVLTLFAGLPASHRLSAQKPFQQIAKVKIRPDLNNNVKFDFGDYIRKDLQAAIQYFTGDNVCDISQWTSVYVTVSESWDDIVNGQLVSIETSPVETSQVFNVANAAIKPRVSMFVNNLYEHVVSFENRTAKWLTEFPEYNHWAQYQFDAYLIADESINSLGGTFDIRYIFYNASGAIISTQTVPMFNLGAVSGQRTFGYIKVRPDEDVVIPANTAYYTMQARTSGGTALSESKRVNYYSDICGRAYTVRWLNRFGVFDTWLFGVKKTESAEIERGDIIRRDIDQYLDQWQYLEVEQQQSNELTKRTRITFESEPIPMEFAQHIEKLKWSPIVYQVSKRTASYLITQTGDYVVASLGQRIIVTTGEQLFVQKQIIPLADSVIVKQDGERTKIISFELEETFIEKIQKI